MPDERGGLPAAGRWLAAGGLLLAVALVFHGPLHPDLEVQMTRIAESAGKWAIVHWTAAAALFCFAVSAAIVLVAQSRLTSTRATLSAWAVVLIGAVCTLATAVTEVTVIADLSAAGDFTQFQAWWSFAEGYANGFAFLALAVATIAWNASKDLPDYIPKWSAVVGALAGVASFTGWALGVWANIAPANLVWVVASGIMCLWLVWLGVALNTREIPGK